MTTRRSFDVPGLQHANPIPMGCIVGNLMMTSGISGIDPETRRAPDDIEGQCRIMFENVRRVMTAAGGSPGDIVKLVVWARDRSCKDALNREWLAMFPDDGSRPARHTMIYDGFVGNVLVQCEVVAVVQQAGSAGPTGPVPPA